MPYYFAVLFADIPFQILGGILFVVPFYFMAGFRLWGPFLNFCVGFFAVMLVAHAFSQLLAFLSPNTDSATILTMLANSVFSLFCGFLLPYESIPVYWRWLYFASLYRYPLGFFAANEMLGQEYVLCSQALQKCICSFTLCDCHTVCQVQLQHNAKPSKDGE